MDAALITQSFELAAERCADLTPLVYARLFADHPAMEALFVRDVDGAVKGEMLARVIEAIVDFIDARAWSACLIQCEVVTHEGYGVPPDIFAVFFATVAATIAELVGRRWTTEMAKAWRELLAELDFYVANPDQSATAKVA